MHVREGIMSNFQPSILQTWLHPLSLSDFLEQHWTRHAYWSETGSERLKSTEELLPDVDLVTLLDYATHPIKAWYLDDNVPVYSLSLGRKEAFHAYRAGLTLYFHLDTSVSARIIRELSRDLARPSFLFKVSIFATRRGGRTVPHVDGNENFTLQLQGTKLWKISAGEEWPGLREKSPNGDLFRILQQPESWNHIEHFEMHPGAILYCPAKYWHTVETIEDSLSLNISIETKYTWADALLPAIRAALVKHPDWSNPDVGLWSRGKRREQSEKQVSQLLQRLSGDLRNLDSGDVLAAWDAADEPRLIETIPETFVRNPFVSCGIVSATLNQEFQVRIESSVRPGKTHTLTFPWKFYSPLLKLMTNEGVLRAREFSELTEMLTELLRYGVLRAV
jgi:hypothetical protein